jgi:hypothetical protein
MAAGTGHLICEERGYPVANPIIVWFDNALPILVDDPDEACFINCFPELWIDAWIDAWLSRRQHRTYYFLRVYLLLNWNRHRRECGVPKCGRCPAAGRSRLC